MSLFQKLLDKIETSEINFYKNKTFQRISWGLAVFIILAGIVTIDFLPDKVHLEVGQVNKTDIMAPKTIEYTDQKRTQELKQEAADSVSKVYEEDLSVVTEVKRNVNLFFDKLKKVRNQDNQLQKKVTTFKRENMIDLAEKDIAYLLKLDPNKLNELKDDVLRILVKYLNRGVKNDYLTEAKDQINQEVVKLNHTDQYNKLVSKIIRGFIQPNLIFNAEETERRREIAKEKVKPVKRTIHKGEVIIRHGRVVTKQDIRILEALGLRNVNINYLNIIGYTLVVLIFTAITIAYIIQYKGDVLDDQGVLYLLGLLPIIILLLAKIANYLPLAYPSFVVPVAASSIIIAILIDYDLAIVFTISLSFLVAIVSGESIIDVGVAIISGLTGIYSVSKLSQRADLVRAGFVVGIVSSLTILTFMLVEPSLELIQFLKIVPLGIINGVIVAILTNGLLPYVENLFGITSPVKLLELSNPNHPLLKRLLVEAPGSYHHSIIVGNLAESAADIVGADSLLARVGAYYHDVGKIKRSYFFTENQIGDENPHHNLSPNLSTLIITSHVKDGIELAKKYKLPQVIIDIIEQHHGTSLVSFFYQEAVYDEKYDNVDEDEFRYDGPKPQSKEAALIMLADIVEAAVRSNVTAQSNPGKLEKLVRELIRKKLDSGQLDESNLTLKDLDKVASAFVSILKGIFHNRIEYPDNIAQQFKEEN